ncbi:putative metal-binding motif-containing protein [Candidatus Woesearchaeota archaeon]|nr:putative metal-binding motif-containing protein [Candidatus Woesearchaeota archaeon]
MRKPKTVFIFLLAFSALFILGCKTTGKAFELVSDAPHTIQNFITATDPTNLKFYINDAPDALGASEISVLAGHLRISSFKPLSEFTPESKDDGIAIVLKSDTQGTAALPQSVRAIVDGTTLNPGEVKFQLIESGNSPSSSDHFDNLIIIAADSSSLSLFVSWLVGNINSPNLISNQMSSFLSHTKATFLAGSISGAPVCADGTETGACSQHTIGRRCTGAALIDDSNCGICADGTPHNACSKDSPGSLCNNGVIETSQLCSTSPRISVTRNIITSGPLSAGQEIQIRLAIDVLSGTDPFTLKEVLPLDANIIETSLPGSQHESQSDMGQGIALEWVFGLVAGSPPVQDTTITYKISLPASATYGISGESSYLQQGLVVTNPTTPSSIIISQGSSINANSCQDNDHDDYGALGTDLSNCGGSKTAFDCDDTTNLRNPGFPEICDTLDNDCDNQADEGVVFTPQACGSSNIGKCKLGTKVCSGGQETCSGDISPITPDTTCDNIDDDCDNSPNPSTCACANGENTNCGIGICSGTKTCSNGAWGQCIDTASNSPAALKAVSENCFNGLDDDCDGKTDLLDDEDCSSLQREILRILQDSQALSRGISSIGQSGSDRFIAINVNGKLGILKTLTALQSVEQFCSTYGSELAGTSSIFVEGGHCANPLAGALLGYPWANNAPPAACSTNNPDPQGVIGSGSCIIHYSPNFKLCSSSPKKFNVTVIAGENYLQTKLCGNIIRDPARLSIDTKGRGIRASGIGEDPDSASITLTPLIP